MSAAENPYAAKCYWPGVTERRVEQAGARAAAEAASRTPSAIAYLGSILFPDDELALCLLHAAARAAVRRTSEWAGIPRDRVMNSRWLPRTPRAIKACPGGATDTTFVRSGPWLAARRAGLRRSPPVTNPRRSQCAPNP